MAENVQIAPAVSATDLAEPGLLGARRPGLLAIFAIPLVTAAGCLGLSRELVLLWAVWTSDPLRSIGMLIPPLSIILTLRVWRQLGWQMRGTWWGLAVVAFSYFLTVLRQKVVLLAVFGNATATLIPISLPLYVYASGIILFFAGTEVWRKAWFPIGLLLLAQPVPILTNGLIDIPLQNVSARVARSFATLIHFAPTTPQLRLMFSPDFGMFIAPGCDGIRGAVTMGYVALVLGYLKRVAWYIWIAFVAGAVLLGYLFNFLRLCILVIYYRIALGHPNLEGVAKQADYVIGSCLFLVATFMFFWIASRRQPATPNAPRGLPGRSIGARGVALRCGAFAVLLLGFLSLPISGHSATDASKFDAESFAAKMPKQIGNFTLKRTWYEQAGGVPAVQAAAYSSPGSDEIILGVWVAALSHVHDPEACWLARGLEPQLITMRPFRVEGGGSEQLNTGFYGDGITDSIVVNALCTPETCSQYQGSSSSRRVGFIILDQMSALTRSNDHPVSIMIRIDRLHGNESKATTQDVLLKEAEQFIAGLNPSDLSRAFQ